MLKQLRFTLLMLALAMLASCGGGVSNRIGSEGQTRGTGQATINVNWPVPSHSRLIPEASESLVAKFTDSKNQLRSTTVIRRPLYGDKSITKIKNLPIGDLTLEVTGRPNSDGSGTAQARGSTKLKIEADKDTPVTITPVSTIVRASLDAGGSFTVPVGGNITLKESCFDAANALVLTSLATSKWQSNDPTVATVDEFGVVKGVKIGNATIKYTETESGVTGSLAVTVGISSQITPNSPQLDPKATQAFTVSPSAGTYPNGVTFTWTLTGNGSLGGGSSVVTTKPQITYTAPASDTNDTLDVTVKDATGKAISKAGTTITVGALPSIQFVISGAWDSRTPPNGSYTFNGPTPNGGRTVGTPTLDALGFAYDFAVENQGVGFILSVPTGHALTSQETFTRTVRGQETTAGQFFVQLASNLQNPDDPNSQFSVPGTTGNLKIDSASQLNNGSTRIRFTFRIANESGGTISGSGAAVIK